MQVFGTESEMGKYKSAYEGSLDILAIIALKAGHKIAEILYLREN